MSEISEERIEQMLENSISETKGIINDTEALKKILAGAEEKIKEIPVLNENVEQLSLMKSLMEAYVSGDYKNISENGIINIVGAFAYLANSNDVIHDALPKVGYLDDLGVLKLAAKRTADELETFGKAQK